jgi:hypothetical protein
MAEAAALRRVEPVSLQGIEPGGADMARPSYREVDPSTLLIDDSYQRSLSEKGKALIARMIAAWDWRSFKPPSVVEVDGELHIIDGQHTAIAACSHPAIDTIPVQVVEAPETAERALAFVRVNRDRVAVSKPEMFHAMVEAGDETAMTVAQVCARAGVTVRKGKPQRDYRVE